MNGFPITIPSLKERTEDIPLLADHFSKKYDFNLAFSDSTMNKLQAYSWPGNVRELENVVRRSAIMATTANRDLIREEDLPVEINSDQSSQVLNSIHKPLETQILESMRSLKFSRSAISQTAKALGNKDRGTITEYFRGICFQRLVSSGFDISQAAKIIAGTNDEEVLAAVKAKINDYLNNLRSTISATNEVDFESIAKGLPKKYHEDLKKIVTFLLDK